MDEWATFSGMVNTGPSNRKTFNIFKIKKLWLEINPESEYLSVILKKDFKTTSNPIFEIDKVSEVQALGITWNKQ